MQDTDLSPRPDSEQEQAASTIPSADETVSSASSAPSDCEAPPTPTFDQVPILNNLRPSIWD